MLFFPYFFCFSAACYKIQSCYSRIYLFPLPFPLIPLAATPLRSSCIHLFFLCFFGIPLQPYLFIPVSFYLYSPAHLYNRTNLSFLPLFSLSFFPPPTDLPAYIFFLYLFHRSLLLPHHSDLPAYTSFFSVFFGIPLQPYPFIPVSFYLYSPAHLTAQICHSCLFFLYPFSRRLLKSHHSVTPAYIFYFLYNLSHFH